MLIWGDKDKIFPISFAHELQRYFISGFLLHFKLILHNICNFFECRNLGPNAKLEIIQDTGHAVNMDSPYVLNALIKGFVLPSSNNGNDVS